MTDHDRPPAHLAAVRTDRGFLRMPVLEATGPASAIRAYESSSADRAAIWLSISDEGTTATVHLDLGITRQLAEQLDHLVRHHRLTDHDEATGDAEPAQPCPHVATSGEGTSYCTLAEAEAHRVRADLEHALALVDDIRVARKAHGPGSTIEEQAITALLAMRDAGST